ATSSKLWGAEIDARCKCCEFCGHFCRWYVDCLAGFRYLNLSEDLTFLNTTQFATNPVLLSGALVNSSDVAQTHNNFYAPQIGVEAGICIGRFNASLYSKIAAGINEESVNLAGQAVVTAPPLPLGIHLPPGGVLPGGLLVQTPGNFHHEIFSYLP